MILLLPRLIVQLHNLDVVVVRPGRVSARGTVHHLEDSARLRLRGRRVTQQGSVQAAEGLVRSEIPRVKLEQPLMEPGATARGLFDDDDAAGPAVANAIHLDRGNDSKGGNA